MTAAAAKSRQLKAANQQLSHLANTDRLTLLFNRGHWEERLSQEFSRHLRFSEVFSLVIFDIDHFKRVNDSYGHPVGDEVIRTVAKLTRDHARATDVVGRYGGEEFAVLLPGTDSNGAFVFAERLRQSLENHTIEYEGQSLKVTISLGIAVLEKHCFANYQELLASADKALYGSKQGGRNRTMLYSAAD